VAILRPEEFEIRLRKDPPPLVQGPQGPGTVSRVSLDAFERIVRDERREFCFSRSLSLESDAR
jgi:hypothetical protein